MKMKLLRTVLVSDIGRSGITAGVHIAIRREYGLMAMDLSSAKCASINNTFTGHLKRLISGQVTLEYLCAAYLMPKCIE